MDLELATLSDMIAELRQRQTRFVLVGIEPSNRTDEATIVHAAQGIHAKDLLGLVKLAYQEAAKQGGEDEDGIPPASLN